MLAALLGIIAPPEPVDEGSQGRSRWEATVTWAETTLQSGANSVWCNDRHDPVIFLSALSQLVRTGRFGFFVSALADRPPLMAAKQMITLDHLCDGRLDVLIDDADLFHRIDEARREHLPLPTRSDLPDLWALDVDAPWPHAVVVDTAAPGDERLHAAEGVIAHHLESRHPTVL
jgi:hypothetical protein